MNKQPKFIHLTVVLLSAFLTACSGLSRTSPTSTPTVPLETPTSTPTATRIPPACPNSSSFGYTGEIQPRGDWCISMAPEFYWYYTIKGISPGSQEAWGDYCIPDEYYLVFSTGPDYSDEIEVQVTNPQVSFTSSTIYYNWVLTTPLEPLKVYRWVVVGRSGPINIIGDQIRRDKYIWLHNDLAWPPFTYMQYDYMFRTGPKCGVGTTATPVLVPVENGISESLSPTLKWEVNSCMPTGFFLHYATSPDFDDPQTVIKDWYTTDTYAQVPTPLLDCTTYYWRVRYRILVNFVEQPADWSEVQSFFVDSGSCPTPTPKPVYIPVMPTNTPIPYIPPPDPPDICTGLNKETCQITPGCTWNDDTGVDPYCMPTP